MGPVVEFTDTLLLVVLVSMAVVLVLSVDQIRRSLIPLRELQEGTRRIAGRDFGSRVSIRSRDEFEELGASFNAMAAELDRQFQALATAAEIDRAVLSATERRRHRGHPPGSSGGRLPLRAACVTLMAPDGPSRCRAWSTTTRDRHRVHVRVELARG